MKPYSSTRFKEGKRDHLIGWEHVRKPKKGWRSKVREILLEE